MTAGPAAWVEIDLAALRDNFKRLSEADPHATIAPVVKADAYGHGAVEVSRTLTEAGAGLLIVARASEAVALRRAGVGGRILVLAPADEETWPSVVHYRLEATCSTPESLDFLRSADSARPVPVHVKINTGMHRLGLPPCRAEEALAALESASAVQPVAICSHLADADDSSSSRTAEQALEFRSLLEALPRRFAALETHLANSAGLLHHDLGEHSYSRPGLALYGYDPARSRDLKPVMSVHARILQIHQLQSNDRVGYGGRWAASGSARVATVAVGYGDGYGWHQVGQPQVLTDRGPRPVVGSLSMDLLSFALEEGDEPAVGEVVTLLGEYGVERIDAHQLAAACETITYEVLLRFGARLPRVYRD